MSNKIIFAPEEELKIINDYKGGLSMIKIAQKYNLGIWTIKNCLNKNNIKKRKPSEYFNYSVNHDFFNVLNESTLWVLGWMFSDGYNCEKRRYIHLTAHKQDIDILNKILVLLDSNHKIYDHSSNKSSYFCIFSDKLSKKLSELGCVQKKSLIIEYPNCFTEEWQHLHFIRGVFEGDGWLSNNKNNITVGISSGSERFLVKIGEIIKKYLNIETKIYKKGQKISNIRIAGKNLQRIKFLDWIYQNGNCKNYLNRKYNRYLEYKKIVLSNPNPKVQIRTIWLYSPEKMVWRVTNLSKFMRTYKTYCLFDVINKKYKQTKGWTLYDIEKLGIPQKYNVFS